MFLIFLTGGVVLSLEVLASRIMTPYFGVSLYIWAGILSITLSFLALGYYFGGKISKRADDQRQLALFFHLPVVAAAAVVSACLIYPFLFPVLARADLILGSFAASGVLLAVPLVCLSAMNPLLISIRSGNIRRGDSGAGAVLFVSTIGSVVGVIVTAFIVIPGFSNFEALLWLAVALCAFTALAGLRSNHLDNTNWRRLIVSAIVISTLSGSVILSQERYFRLLEAFDGTPIKASIIAEYSSVFGNIKVANLWWDGDENPPNKTYLQDGLFQNRTTPNNESISMYTYVLDRLVAGFVPNAKSVLVMGLGAGIVPRDLRRRGMAVSIVDINPQSVVAARDHFGFDPGSYVITVTDARNFVRDCTNRFDAIVVDLFQGDSTPDYLMTAEFFADLKRCLNPGGAIAMNAFLDDANDGPNRRLLATISASFGQVIRFGIAEGNSFIVGALQARETPIAYDLAGVPEALEGIVLQTLRSGSVVRSESLLGYAPVTDRHNVMAPLMANAQMAQRRWLAAIIPARLLVN